MAEAIANELVKVVFQKLADEAFKRIARAQGIHKELEQLKKTLSAIQVLLIDASQKEVTDKSVKQWLNGLQHLAYDIDDVLDDLATDAMNPELTQESETIICGKVRKLIQTCCTNFSISHRLSPKLDSITTELKHLEKLRNDLGLVKKDERPRNTSRRNETSLPERDVVGREVEKEKLINKLLGDDGSSKENFSLLPIVGMGGVGKTTLARLLYNDTRVEGHFQLKAWVCVSDDFDIFKISDTILQDVTKENKEFKDLNQLQMALAEQFRNKRFLLVVDDVWTENYGDWENLVRPFLWCAPGSRIIVTTRKEQLLKQLGFNNLDCLESLSHEDALCLLALHALAVDNFESHTTLKPLGEGIVKKCARLPLALKAIGRLLRTKIDREDWADVLNSDIWDIENGNEKENSDKIIPALRLSYHDLSADLKQLFAYCSLFPKDFLFNKEELVLLWIAEGFLNPSNTTKSLERLGLEYFEILLSRSFFQHAPNEDSLFIMHDLMNDLATLVAGEFFLRFDSHMEIRKEALSKYRYMSFIREKYIGYHKFEALKRARSLRTLLAVSIGVVKSWESFCFSSKILVELLPQLPMLRVLSLSHLDVIEVPEVIGSLKHLRYLNLSRTKIKELPENVGNLYNLQTLILFGCWELTKLPKSFLKLKKLRHFDIRKTWLLKKLPLGIGELKSLYTFTKIIIGGDDGFEISELKEFKNLHGRISIEGLQRVQSVLHAREANLSLKEISKLELKWFEVFDGSRRGSLEKEVLNELEPNRDRLTKLTIVSYGGTEFSKWVGDSSYHELVKVSLCGCHNCTSLPPFWQLPSLKKLFIQGMDKLKIINLELTKSGVVAFPSLEVLKFEALSCWEEWLIKNDGLDGVFPCLRELHIEDCPKLINVSIEAPSLKVLKINRCGDGVLRSLVQAASSITMLDISSISGLTYEVWRGVIEHIGAVEEVSIEECNEIRYLWESEAEASKVLVNLKNLEISECTSLLSLGEREEEDNFGGNLLSSLKMLSIFSCNNMVRFCCPNSTGIESLRINRCGSVIRVSFPTIGTQVGWQKLKFLLISNVEKLMGKINIISMPMLETLEIYDWTNLKSITHLTNLIHLTKLNIYNCPGIESFPDLKMLNLTYLSIFGCKNMKSLPELSNLTLLKELQIIYCPSIEASFPHGLWPPRLCSLEIGGYKKPILEWGAQIFPTSLVVLGLYNEPYVTNFSRLSHLLPSSLTRFELNHFYNLESLLTGLEHLTVLQHLDFTNCPKMIYLPETLLPSLLSLKSFRCPILKERCNGRGSHYWPLISHIPHIMMTDLSDTSSSCSE